MTWKQFVRKVEDEIRSNGIDLDRQPIDFRTDAINSDDRLSMIQVNVNPAEMPRRARISIYVAVD